MAENLELNLLLKGGAKATKTIGELEKGLEQAREEIKGVAKGSEDFDKLATAIQQASSEVKTLEKQMEGLEPQQKAEAFLKMGEGIAGGFMAAQGAMGLLGIESENLEKIQVKVQSAIAIAMGIRMMSEAALMAKTAMRVAEEKLSIVTTKANTIATKLATIAQKGLRNALGLSVKSLKALKVAIATTGIGALVVGIGSLIAATRNASDSTDTLQNKLDAYNNALDRENKQLQKNNKAKIENTKFELRLAAAQSETERQLILNEQAQHESLKRQEEANEGVNRNTNFLKTNNKTIQENIANINKQKGSFHDLGGVISSTEEFFGSAVSGSARSLKTYNERLEAARKRAKQNERDRDNYRAQSEKETDVQNELIKQHDKLEKQLKRENKLQQENATNTAKANQANEKAKQLRKDQASQLLSLQQEIELLNIQDDDARAKRKLEIDKENALSSTTITSEIEAQIKEKYRLLEEQRQDEYWDKFIEKNNEFNEKRLEENKEAGEKQNEIDQQIADYKQETIANSFSAIAGLFENNKKASKAIAVAETIYSTQQGIMGAFASPADKALPTFVKFANAAAIGAMGIASVRNILNDSMGSDADLQANMDKKQAAMDSMIPANAGAFTLGGAMGDSEPLKAFVVTDELSDSQEQLANIRRRATI